MTDQKLQGDFAEGLREEPDTEKGDFATGEAKPHDQTPRDFAEGQEEESHGGERKGTYGDREPER